MVKMKKYCLGIEVNGNVHHIVEVIATNLFQAKKEWARLTGHLDPCWHTRKQTYFGWPIVETKEEAMKRKSGPSRWSY